MAIESFWKIPDVSNVKTPVSIFKEQAEALSQDTKGILLGYVESSNSGVSDLVINFYIVVPTMNRFTIKVVSYYQPITLYPGRITDEVGNKIYDIPNEELFVRGLKTILGSDKVVSVITSLLSQALNVKK